VGGGKGSPRHSDFIEKRSGLVLVSELAFSLIALSVTSSAIRSLELRDGRGLIGVSLAAELKTNARKRGVIERNAPRGFHRRSVVSLFGRTFPAGTATREIHPLLVISIARLRANPLACTHARTRAASIATVRGAGERGGGD